MTHEWDKAGNNFAGSTHLKMIKKRWWRWTGKWRSYMIAKVKNIGNLKSPSNRKTAKIEFAREKREKVMR